MRLRIPPVHELFYAVDCQQRIRSTGQLHEQPAAADKTVTTGVNKINGVKGVLKDLSCDYGSELTVRERILDLAFLTRYFTHFPDELSVFRVPLDSK